MKKIIFLFFISPSLAIAQEKSTIDNVTVSINCDSIYSKKGLSLILIRYEYEEQDGYENEKNCTFILRNKVNEAIKEVYRDTIFSKVQEITFDDFNGDNVKDILVQNTSDVRSNWSYSLYLVNPKDYTLRKVKGFEVIKNPFYNAKYKIIESRVSSGQDYTRFYKIIKNKVYDYKLTVYYDNQENDNDDKAYERAIQKILKRNKALSKKKK